MNSLVGLFWSASASQLLAIVGGGLAAATAAYAWIAACAVMRTRRLIRKDDQVQRQAERSEPRPPVTVFKPLCGPEVGLYSNLRGFCTQDYPDFQLLFGVRDADDPAISVVRRLQCEFPQLDMRLVIDPRVHGSNLKVSNLINLLAHARHEWLVIADSDIAVGSDYLSRVTAPLGDPDVGIVTCLYNGVPRGGVWTRVAAQFVDDWFAPSVCVANWFGSTRFSFGATLALRREVLAAAGGFEAVSDLLADDFWLGEFTRRLGLRTVLSPVVVRTDTTDNTLAQLWAHELRWLRTIRAAAPLGFAFSFMTFTVPCLAAALWLDPSRNCAWIVAAGLVARLIVHLGSRREAPSLFAAALIPLRDTLSLAGWAFAHVGSRVRWRNQVLDAFADSVPAAVPAGRTFSRAVRALVRSAARASGL